MVELCRQGLQTLTVFKTKIFHLATLFKAKDLNSNHHDSYRFAYRIKMIKNLFYTTIRFFWKQIVLLNATHCRLFKAHRQPLHAFKRLPVQKDTVFKALNDIVVYPFLTTQTLETIPCSAAHTRYGQIRKCPSPRVKYGRVYHLIASCFESL